MIPPLLASPPVVACYSGSIVRIFGNVLLPTARISGGPLDEPGFYPNFSALCANIRDLLRGTLFDDESNRCYSPSIVPRKIVRGLPVLSIRHNGNALPDEEESGQSPGDETRLAGRHDWCD
jgi:hypothetical protein